MPNNPQKLVGPLPGENTHHQQSSPAAPAQEDVSLSSVAQPDLTNDLTDWLGPQRCPHCRHYPNSSQEEGFLCHFCKYFLSEEQRQLFVKSALGWCTGSCSIALSQQELLDGEHMCASCAATEKDVMEEILGDVLAFEVRHGTFLPPLQEFVTLMCAEMLATGRCANLKCTKNMMINDRIVPGSKKPEERYVFCTFCRRAIVALVDTKVAHRTTTKPSAPRPGPPDQSPESGRETIQVMFSFANSGSSHDIECGDDGSDIYYAGFRSPDELEDQESAWEPDVEGLQSLNLQDMAERGSPPPRQRPLGQEKKFTSNYRRARFDFFILDIAKSAARRNANLPARGKRVTSEPPSLQKDTAEQGRSSYHVSSKDVAFRAVKRSLTEPSIEPRTPPRSSGFVPTRALQRKLQEQVKHSQPEPSIEPRTRPKGGGFVPTRALQRKLQEEAAKKSSTL